MGIVTIPLRDGKPMSNEDLLSLKPEEKEEINRRGEKLQDRLKAVFRQIRSLDRSAVEELQKIDRQVALFTLGPLIEDLKEKYSDNPAVVSYLEEMQEDMLENLNLFRQEGQSPQAALPFPIPGAGDLPFRKYRVNALIDNSKTEGAPVVMELNPTYNNLFGRLEKEAQFGALFTDFTMIREGALHRANGGYLVMPVEEVFRNLFSWESLKRALRNKGINIEEPGERLGFLTTKSLKPQPVPLDIRVILIGTSFIYHLLYELDADFRELFKVKAHFDTVMDRTDENIRYYLGYICRICEEEKLKHLDSSALTKILEHGVKLAEDQQKLSTRFGEIADIIREAGFYASRDGAELVSGTHVRKAIEEKIYRSNLIQEKIGEMIEQNALKIDVDGAQVGQVNGLSVIDLGDLAFGRPNRITASIGMGREGLIDIEREAKLGGPIHTKGVMILSGYLAGKYAQDRPLSLAARLVFEQSYSGVEGDSASSTELYAILSSLSELPIHQGIAVTGSVNQKGEVQAIGGVNEKIEGFYEVCRAKGLTGRQGVMIPKSNVRNLMLKEEIVEKVRDEKFHIWAVDSIDEGIEILTGRKAGEKKDGKFEEGSVNNLIERQLKHLSETMREYAGPDGARKEKSAGEEAEKRVPA
jgi:lon-related putative ATP-dependent protease